MQAGSAFGLDLMDCGWPYLESRRTCLAWVVAPKQLWGQTGKDELLLQRVRNPPTACANPSVVGPGKPLPVSGNGLTGPWRMVPLLALDRQFEL